MLGRDGSETRPHTTHGDARARTLAPTSLCSPPRYNCRTMADWARRLGLSREALINSARTAVATVASLLLARSLKLPEFYWAPISTIVILLSTINPLTLAWQRVGGAAGVDGQGGAIAALFEAWRAFAGLLTLLMGSLALEIVRVRAPGIVPGAEPCCDHVSVRMIEPLGG